MKKNVTVESTAIEVPAYSEEQVSHNKALSAVVLKEARKNKNAMNGQLIGSVPVSLMFVDFSVQRAIKGVRWNKVVKMADSYDPAKAGMILVSYRKDIGLFHIIDGQARWEAAKRSGQSTMLAYIMQDMSQADEAALFHDQKNLETSLTAKAKFMPGLIASQSKEGYEEYPVVWNAMHRYKIKDAHQISALGECLNIAKRDPAKIDWIFNVIVSAGWNDMDNGFGRTVIRALDNLCDSGVSDNAVKEILIPKMKEYSPVDFIAVATIVGNPRRTQYMNLCRIFTQVCEGKKSIIRQLAQVKAAQ